MNQADVYDAYSDHDSLDKEGYSADPEDDDYSIAESGCSPPPGPPPHIQGPRRGMPPPPPQGPPPKRQELIEVFGYENEVFVNGGATQRCPGLHIYIAGHNNKVVVGHE